MNKKVNERVNEGMNERMNKGVNKGMNETEKKERNEKKKRRMRILWISRHVPLPKQLSELKRIFGDFELFQYSGFVRDAGHIIELKHLYNADEIVLVVPMTIIYHLVKAHNIYPIFPKMKSVETNTSSYDYCDPETGRKYVFEKFVRIKDIKIEEEEL